MRYEMCADAFPHLICLPIALICVTKIRTGDDDVRACANRVGQCFSRTIGLVTFTERSHDKSLRFKHNSPRYK